MPPAKKTITVGDVSDALDRMAPPALAQEWDNVGLLAGDRAAGCDKALLCIDLTPAVLDEAVAAGAGLIVAYHPPLFRPIKRLLADSGETDSLIFRAIRRGIAIYSPHTALDAVQGGTNDVLAGLCGVREAGPFEYVPVAEPHVKLVTFLPEKDLDRVASALFAAGAGRIGDYEQCSFRLRGEGTFFGTEATDPRVGRKGRLEKVPEMLLETVAPHRLLPEILAALRAAHPYEEPAFDLNVLMTPPAAGIGRVGDLPRGLTLGRLASRLARATGSKVTMTVGDPRRRVRRAAICVGAAGRLPLDKPRCRDCDVIVTGEIRHHDALALLRAGRTAIALGHWESERPVLKPLALRLRKDVAGLAALVSRKDAPPFGRA